MMRRVGILTSMCLLLASAICLSAQKTPIFDVTGPTIIAFFPPVTDEELRKHRDSNEALSDFQFYARQVREPLAKKGITFKEVYADAFTIRQGKVTTLFGSKTMKVGYCLATPGKETYVQTGVLSDAGLLQLADKYFGTSEK